jgi:hypothetical protein
MGDEHSAIEEAFLARRVGGVVEGGVDEGNSVIDQVLVDDVPVGVFPVTIVAVDDGPVCCSDVEGGVEGGVGEGNNKTVEVLVDDGPVGVVPLPMVVVGDGPVCCSDVEGVGEGVVLRDDHGAGMDNANGLKYFTPSANMVALYGSYVRYCEVPCKATFLGKRCLTGILVPNEGTIYKGHQCKKCDHFNHSICTGAFPDSLVFIVNILFQSRLSHDSNKNIQITFSPCCAILIRCRRFE